MNLYTKFLITYLNENGKWVCENIYYRGDHFERDMNDWRFCNVFGKRCSLQFLRHITMD